jgi:hypothetical protein
MEGSDGEQSEELKSALLSLPRNEKDSIGNFFI